MWTLGIDVAKRRHNATLLDAEGKTVFKNFSFEHSKKGIKALMNMIAETNQSPVGIKIGMEATGHYWMVIFQHLTSKGFTVCVINPIVTAARRNVSIRGSKTDAIDALLIAQVMRDSNCRISAVPKENIQSLRKLTRLRFECAQAATSEKQKLIALLDLVFPEYHNHFSDIFGAASRQVLSQFPTAQMLAKVDIRKLTRILKQASKGRLGKEHATRLKNEAKNSFSLTGNTESLALEIRFVLERINLLTEQIAKLDKQFANFLPDEQKLLMTISGIAKVWAPTILAEVLPVFHPNEKKGARKLVAAAGIDVKLSQSGESSKKGKMSKRGSKYLRTAIIQAADVAVFIAKDPMLKTIYEKQKARGKHHTVALSHVANKMLHVVFSVLKHKKPYKPIS